MERIENYGSVHNLQKDWVLCVLRGNQNPNQVKRDTPIASAANTKICAIVPTSNSLHELRRCVDSLRGWVNEVIVVDSASSDGTPALALELADKVIDNPPYRHSALTINAAAMCTDAGWILVTFPDEEISGELSDRLRRLSASDIPHSAVSVPFRYQFAGRDLAYKYGVSQQLRFFKNGKFCFTAIDGPSVSIDGQQFQLSANDPKECVIKWSHSTVTDIFSKINSLTARDLLLAEVEQGNAPNWEFVTQQFVRRLQQTYESEGAREDSEWGWYRALMDGVESILRYAKLFEVNAKSGRLSQVSAPTDVRSMLEHAINSLEDVNIPRL